MRKESLQAESISDENMKTETNYWLFSGDECLAGIFP